MQSNDHATSAGRGNRRSADPLQPRTLGPVSDLERHLPSDWWRTLFNSIYLKTDGDVVENVANTRREVEIAVETAGMEKDDRILDLCCGQGRHLLELARQGFRNLTGLDRSRYLVRLARKRAEAERLAVTFHEGDARRIGSRRQQWDRVMILGNSFGYFEHSTEDEAVLRGVDRVLSDRGRLVMDIVDGDWMRENFEKRSWEWIDQNHFVCRERALAQDGRRIVTREVVTHAERGVLADQFYAERLYSCDEMLELLRRIGFRDVQSHDAFLSESTRGQDLGMMARRLWFSGRASLRAAPAVGREARRKVTVLLGDPSLPDKVKVEGHFNPEDFDTIRRMREALAELRGYRFEYLDRHDRLINHLTSHRPDFVLNLCDEGFLNDAFKELHVPALLEMLGIGYTGAGPACLGLCYNKNLVRAAAESIDIPTPLETYIGPDDTATTLPATFPALLKPNFGDSSMGITQDAVVNNADELLAYANGLREQFGPCSILVQEFLTGPEYSVGIVGNPGYTCRVLPVLEVDYSALPPDLPRILGYESKWMPDSPYWERIQYREARLDEDVQRPLVDAANALFTRLGCRDYARFDFRADSTGMVKLLEVNPNPGWCWDGKMNIMAGYGGITYAQLLESILRAAEERLAEIPN